MSIMNDIRYGLRSLLKQPGFTAVCVFSIALGIGVNTALFSFVNTILFRPLAFPDSNQLVRVWDGNSSSYPDYEALRDDTKGFSALAAYAQRPLNLTVNDSSERVYGEIVTGNYFDILQSRPIIGRAFLEEEDRTPNTHPVVVISNSLWRRKFNSDSLIVGKVATINKQPYTVIGVMPEGFIGATVISPPDLWLPMMMQPSIDPGSQALKSPDEGWLMMLGRLKPEVSVGQAQAAVETIAARLHEARRERNSGPEEHGGRVVLVAPARGLMVPPQGRTPMFLVMAILMTVVTLVLLVACANVANMLLARAMKRRKEIAVRIALGARRWRIVRQTLTESILLSLGGGVGGLLMAWWVTRLPFNSIPQSIRGNVIAPDVSPDLRVFVYTLLLSIFTGIVFGLVPALQTSKPDLIPDLKDEASLLSVGRRRFRFRNLLVVSQIAVSALLLICAGLFIRNLSNVQHAEPGFVIDKGLMMTFDLGLANYNQARGKAFEEGLLARVRALPQVRSASLAESVPLSGGGSISPLYIEGEPSPVQFDEASLLHHNTVTSDYFSTLGIPLISGRDFNNTDTSSSPGVIIVNETLARRIAANGSAIGKRIRMDSKGDYLEVVGVVRDIKYDNLAEKPAFFGYRPLTQSYRSGMTLHVSTSGDPLSLVSQIRAEVKALDADLPLTDIETMQEHMRLPLAPAKLLAAVSSSFGVLALLLAAMGLYGVMAYLVSSRTREMGIRIALGAQTSGVLRLVMGQGLRLAITGIALGVITAVALTRVLESVLYGVAPTDVVTFMGVVLLLIAVALVASYIPARRATKVDPLVALRYE